MKMHLKRDLSLMAKQLRNLLLKGKISRADLPLLHANDPIQTHTMRSALRQKSVFLSLQKITNKPRSMSLFSGTFQSHVKGTFFCESKASCMKCVYMWTWYCLSSLTFQTIPNGTWSIKKANASINNAREPYAKQWKANRRKFCISAKNEDIAEF